MRPYTGEVDLLKEKLKNIPNDPGVYLFKDEHARVIYVGKAKNLRNRVGQYFGHDSRPQIPFLISEAVDIDVVIASSELESLFLENTLIKKYLPKYNIKLRDDKNYAFIEINYSTHIPQIGYARKLEKGTKSTYFGPYSSAFKIRRTLDFVRRIFPYCANKEIGKRPCFYYFLHRCPGVCVGKISLAEYEEQLQRIELFLSGKTQVIKKELKISMANASSEQQYELAGRLRDQLSAIELLEERQIAQFPVRVDWDFISVYSEGVNTCVNLFKIREGKLIDKENFIYVGSQNKADIICTFMEMYYAEATDIPKEIYTQEQVSSYLLELLLNERSKRKISVTVPSRGKKLELITLGIANGQQFLHKWEGSNAQNLDALKRALEELKTTLGLPTLPRRIEGYDISNIQGTNPVGSMVVAKDGLATKSEYKKFKINVKNTPDDFAMMSEMISRRLQHLESRAPGPESREIAIWEAPDLIMIDGGKGQLSAVVKILEDNKISIPVIGLAKRIEEIFLPHSSEPIILSHDSPALQILQRLRDEAHRFAITFHRSLRSKQAIKSELDTIPGIGPVTKKILKKKFGTIQAIRETSPEDLSTAVGPDKAKKIKAYLT